MARALFSLLVVLVFSQYSTASLLTEVDLKAPLRELASIFRSEFPLPQHIALDRHVRASQHKLLQVDEQQPAPTQHGPDPCELALQQLANSGCLWKPEFLRGGPNDLAEHLDETCQRCDRSSLGSIMANVVAQCRDAHDLAGVDVRFTGMLGDLMEHVCGDTDCFAQLLTSFISGDDGDGGDEPTKPWETDDHPYTCRDELYLCDLECAHIDDLSCKEDCMSSTAECPKPVNPCKDDHALCESECAGKDDIEVCMHDCLLPTCRCDDELQSCYNRCKDEPTQDAVAACKSQCVLSEDCKLPEDIQCGRRLGSCEAECIDHADPFQCASACAPLECICPGVRDTCKAQCPEGEGFDMCYASCMEEKCTPPIDMCSRKFADCATQCSSSNNPVECVRDCVPQECKCPGAHNTCTSQCSDGDSACYEACMVDKCQPPPTDLPYPPTYPPISGECNVPFLCARDECGQVPVEFKEQCIGNCVDTSLTDCTAQCSPGPNGSNDVQSCIASCIADKYDCVPTNTDNPITYPYPPTHPPISGECNVPFLCARDECGQVPVEFKEQCISNCVDTSLTDCTAQCSPGLNGSNDVGSCIASCIADKYDCVPTNTDNPITYPTEPPITEATSITDPPITNPPAGECVAYVQCRDDECGHLPEEAKPSCIETCMYPKIAACMPGCQLVGVNDAAVCVGNCLGDNCSPNRVPITLPTGLPGGQPITLPTGPGGQPITLPTGLPLPTITIPTGLPNLPGNPPFGLLSLASNHARAHAYHMARARREYVKLQQQQQQQQGGDEQPRPGKDEQDGGLEDLPDAMCLPCARRLIAFASQYLFDGQNGDSSSLMSGRCLSRSFDVVCARETGSNERCIDRFGEVFGNFDGSSIDGNLGEFCDSSCLWDLSNYYEEIADSGCLGATDPFEDFTCLNSFRLSDVCTKNERGQICSEALSNFDFSAVESDCKVDMSSMSTNSTLIECPEACSTGISDAVDELGCCVPFMFDIGCHAANTNALELFVEARCGVELPETCARPTQGLSAASTLSHLSLSAVVLAVSALALSN